MKDRKNLIHIDDSKSVLEFVSDALEPIQALEGLELKQLTNKYDYLCNPNLEADLYLLDRHFPEKQGMQCNDYSWKELTKFIGQMFPDKGVILLTSEPPADRIWRPFKNIRTVLNKDKVYQDYIGFSQTIKHYLSENGTTR